MSARQIVIVGGGPAGIATALFLSARAPELASRIVVLEKATYPREKPCAGAIGGRAERALASIGVQVDVPSVPISAMRARLASGTITGRRSNVGRVVRRIEFDAALARLARERGIRIEENTRVTGIAWPGDHVRVDIAGRGGESRTLEANAVVGADGVGSVVRRAMSVPFGRLRAQVVEVDTEVLPSDGPRDELAFDFSDESYAGYTWDFPTVVGGRPLVCRGAYVLYGSRARPDGPDPEVVLSSMLVRLGLDPAAYKRKRFAERGLALSEPIARPRTLLVGEAAGIDPLLGEGIAQAILYGALAADYLAPRIAAGRYEFADWRRTMLTSRVGVDLAVRIAMADIVFGPRRPIVEACLLGRPPLLDAGLRYFGGEPSRWAWGAAGMGALYTLLRHARA